MESTSRVVRVEPERLAGWLERFAARHGETAWFTYGTEVVVTAADGSRATIGVPFPPLVLERDAPFGGLLAHVARDRRVGVLLVRRGGYAAGVFDGTTLVSSKVGRRQVQGRSAAGGWSQQRFARRREGQAKALFGAAADVAAAVLVPEAPRLEAVVAGGDRRAVEAVLEDPRLRPLEPLVADRFLDVPDPRLTVLQSTAAMFRAARIQVVNEWAPWDSNPQPTD